MFWNRSRAKKRPMLLLEVIIALALVALCIIPLVVPYVAVIRQQQLATQTMELDHLVNLLYVDLLEKLYENQIPWETIEEGSQKMVDPQMLSRLKEETGKSFPFQVTYQFHTLREKRDNKSDNWSWSLHEMELVIAFWREDAPSRHAKPAYQFPLYFTMARHNKGTP